jgi:hypothetical protein
MPGSDDDDIGRAGSLIRVRDLLTIWGTGEADARTDHQSAAPTVNNRTAVLKAGIELARLREAAKSA